MKSELTTVKLLQHYGHHITIAKYGDGHNDVNVALECEDCNEVLADSDLAWQTLPQPHQRKTGTTTMYTQDELKITARALKHLLASTDLTEKESFNAEAAAGYINGFINGDMIMNIWTVDDVKSLGEDNDGIAPVTDEEAREVLANVDKYHDASVGINWEVLEAHLDMVRAAAQPRRNL